MSEDAAQHIVGHKQPAPACPDRGGFLEICVETSASATAAVAGGADQLEVCSALALGGLTPSAGLVADAVDAAQHSGVAVRAMVRPRPGDFTYDEQDLRQAITEARHLLAQGVQGLVFGAVRSGQPDIPHLRRWIDAVRETPGGATAGLTFHRAIDLTDDPVAAVEAIAALGFDTILSSGGAPTALDGAERLAAMAGRAGNRCTILAGSGINPANAATLLARLGQRALHASARLPAPAATAPPARFGFGEQAGGANRTVVSQLRAILDNA